MMGSFRSQRWIRTCSAALLAIAFVVPLKASETVDPVAPDALAVLQLDGPLRLLDHPLVANIWQELSQSELLQQRLAAPDADPIHQMRRLLEVLHPIFGHPLPQGEGLASRADWRHAAEELTAGGAWLAISPGQSPGWTAILTADNDQAWPRFLATVHAAMQARASGSLNIPRESYRGCQGYRLGNVYYGVLANRLVAANERHRWKAAVDCLAEDGRFTVSRNSPSVASSTGEDDRPVARLTINVEALRSLPNVAPILDMPTDRADLIAVWGGWIDLLRRGDRVTVEISTRGPALEARVAAANLDPTIAKGLEEFFATPADPADASSQSAPLLRISGMIYSASWYRDYGSMWRQRAEFLEDDTRQKLEQKQTDIAKQLTAVRVKDAALLSSIVSQLGPHFRVVVAPKGKTVYSVPLSEKLPTAALVVDLHDEEQVRSMVEPIIRGFSLIAALQKQGLHAKKLTHRGANLVSFVFLDDDLSAQRGNKVRFNFEPTYAIARGHLIVGATQQIVKDCLAELARQADLAPAADDTAGVTDEQFLSLQQVSEALRDYQESLVRSSVLKQGLTVSQAEHEIGVLHGVLAVMGNVQIRMTSGPDSFEIVASIVPSQDNTGN